MAAADSTNDALGPFHGISLEEQIEAWVASPSDRRPEEHPAVAHFSQHPPAGIDFQIIDEITIQQSWANQTALQCNVCGREHKFFRRPGYLASYGDGWWYLVGPDCGGEDHATRFALAINRRRRREAERQADEYVRRFIEYRPQWMEFYLSLRPPVEAMFNLWNTLKTEQPSLFGALENVTRAGGGLKIMRNTREKDQRGNRIVAFDTIANLRGGSLFVSSSPARPLRDLQEKVSGLVVLLDKRMVDDLLVDYHKRDKLPQLSKSLQANVAAMASIKGAINSAQAFVDPANLADVVRWAGHPKSTASVRVEIADNDNVLVFRTSHGTSRPVDVTALRAFGGTPPY